METDQNPKVRNHERNEYPTDPDLSVETTLLQGIRQNTVSHLLTYTICCRTSYAFHLRVHWYGLSQKIHINTAMIPNLNKQDLIS